MDSLQDLKNKVDDAIKRQRSNDIDLTIVETQLKNKKLVLGRLEEAISDLEKKRESLESDNKAKNRAMDEASLAQKNEAQKLIKRAQEDMENVRIGRNALAVEKNEIQDQKKQAVMIIAEYSGKKEKLKNLIAEMNKVL